RARVGRRAEHERLVARGAARAARRRDAPARRGAGRDRADRRAHPPRGAARWARLPRGARPLANPLGGAPGFAIENVYVLPGLPSEMEAMFDAIAGDFRRGAPIAAWRRTFATRESRIAPALV